MYVFFYFLRVSSIFFYFLRVSSFFFPSAVNKTKKFKADWDYPLTLQILEYKCPPCKGSVLLWTSIQGTCFVMNIRGTCFVMHVYLRVVFYYERQSKGPVFYERLFKGRVLLWTSIKRSCFVVNVHQRAVFCYECLSKGRVLLWTSI